MRVKSEKFSFLQHFVNLRLEYVCKNNTKSSEIYVLLDGNAFTMSENQFYLWFVDILKKIRFFNQFHFSISHSCIEMLSAKSNLAFCIWIYLEPEIADSWYMECLNLYLLNASDFSQLTSTFKNIIREYFVKPVLHSTAFYAHDVQLYQDVLCKSFKNIVNENFPQYSNLNLDTLFLNTSGQNEFVSIHTEINCNSASNFTPILSPPTESVQFDFLLDS